jgi:NhaP-type Na+/H+ or K+/H+ antiporter
MLGFSRPIPLTTNVDTRAAEALLALLAGIIFGPIALDWFSPMRWAGSEHGLRELT